MPLVSIITPLFHAEPFVEELARSVAAQTLTDSEWICVDDCSPDRSVERLQAAAPGRLNLRILRLPANGGPAAARNAGIRMASGRYVAFLDADDLWLADKLQRQVEFMVHHGHRFTFHDYRRMSFDGASVSALVRGPNVVDWDLLHKRRGIGCLTVMLERSAVPDDLFPERTELGERFIHEDFVAWSRMLQGGARAHRLPLDLARYRLARNSLSANKFRGIRSIWHIYRRCERIPFLRCAWYFLNYLVHASLIRAAASLPAHRRARAAARAVRPRD